MTKQYEGGYFMINDPIVRGYGANGHTARDLGKLSSYTVEAINYIQETPWKVNPWVKDLIKQFAALGKDVTVATRTGDQDIVLALAEPISPREYFTPDGRENPNFNNVFANLDPEDWNALPKPEKQKMLEKRHRLLKKWEESVGVYRATKRIIALAEEMGEFDQFFYPHNMDFRTRIYPIPNDLTPQSNDLSKGLLSFARPTRLGDEGVYWMGVMVSTHWGQDKLGMDERYDFALDMLTKREIESWVDDPINNRGWLKADKPFQFIAVAYEWVWAFRTGDASQFMSYLPGNLDGSCNGAQHLSILARDTKGATLTNCRADPKRHDLYMKVADSVWEKVQFDVREGNPLAIEWAPKLQHPSDRRLVVKRAVMTVPYGVTQFGIADFMLKDGHVDENAESRWDSAKYMRDLIWNSIEENLTAGRAIQVWISTMAAKCAEKGLPFVWDTPAGSRVTQAYREVIAKRVSSFGTKFYVYEEPEVDEDQDDFVARLPMNESKMATSAPPNVIHSFDASHLQITTCRMRDAGIKDFSMIHDSFGCPLGQVGLMRDILRQSFVDMYRDNFLQKLKESVERYSGLTMPDAPELGDFDINEILQSEFFFS
jgi:DNA-directed RNA polymerase